MTAPTLTLPRPGSTLLNDRDRYLLRLLAEDYTRRVQALLGKTCAGTREELVATALRSGWIAAQDTYGAAA